MSEVGQMRNLGLIALLLASAPASAQLVLPPQDDRPPTQLAPIDPGSDWHARLEEAGITLGTVLGDGPAGQWQQHFGGAWLNPADRERIAALLGDKTMAFHRVLVASGAYEQVVLGWQPADGGAAYAALAGRPEADAIICWREFGSAVPWPTTAAEADDRRRHACVRLAYSIRFEPAQWRAFVDAPLSAAD
jgi:hypothetical protein